MVALKDLAETHPELHGAAKDCVIRSRRALSSLVRCFSHQSH